MTRSEYLYRSLLHELVMMLESNWSPHVVVVVDYERALICAVRKEFGESRILGCFFHFKQAIFKKMQKFSIPHHEILVACEEIALLTLISHSDIEKWIEYIQSNPQLESDKWSLFWHYFKSTWIRRFDLSLWNISDIPDRDLCGRTNNPIERYNRRLNERLTTHSNICVFVSVIRDEELFFSTYCDDIRRGVIKPPVLNRVFERPEISPHFLQFKRKKRSKK